MGNKLPLYQPGSPWIANLVKGYFSSTIGMLTSQQEISFMFRSSNKCKMVEVGRLLDGDWSSWMRPLRPLELFSDLLAPSPPIKVNKCKQDCLLLSGLRTRRIYYVKSFENIAQIQLIAFIILSFAKFWPQKKSRRDQEFLFPKIVFFFICHIRCCIKCKIQGSQFHIRCRDNICIHSYMTWTGLFEIQKVFPFAGQ